MIEDLSGKSRTVGLKQTIKALQLGQINFVYLADDADINIINKIKEMCNECNVQIQHIDTKKQLGKACGIQVGAAVAGVCIEK